MLQCAVASQWGIRHLVSFTSGYSYVDSINLVPDPKLCADFSMQMEGLRVVVFAPYEGWIIRCNWNGNRSGDGEIKLVLPHFLGCSQHYYGLVISMFGNQLRQCLHSCYTSHHIEVVTFAGVTLLPALFTYTGVLLCSACSWLAAEERQTLWLLVISHLFSTLSSHFLNWHSYCLSEVCSLSSTYLVMKI